MESILRISETVSLAFHLMVILARNPGTRRLAQDMTDGLGVPLSYPAKVLQKLAHAGLVDSIRGRHGGYKLTRPPQELTLLDVFEAIEGPWEMRTCVLRKPMCIGHSDGCLLGDTTEKVHRLVHEHLQRTTLQSLANADIGFQSR